MSACLHPHHVADRDDREPRPVGLARGRLDRRRSRGPLAAAERVRAHDEEALGVDRQPGADHALPPPWRRMTRADGTGRRGCLPSTRGRSGWRWRRRRRASPTSRRRRRSRRAPLRPRERTADQWAGRRTGGDRRGRRDATRRSAGRGGRLSALPSVISHLRARVVVMRIRREPGQLRCRRLSRRIGHIPRMRCGWHLGAVRPRLPDPPPKGRATPDAVRSDYRRARGSAKDFRRGQVRYFSSSATWLGGRRSRRSRRSRPGRRDGRASCPSLARSRTRRASPSSSENRPDSGDTMRSKPRSSSSAGVSSGVVPVSTMFATRTVDRQRGGDHLELGDRLRRFDEHRVDTEVARGHALG